MAIWLYQPITIPTAPPPQVVAVDQATETDEALGPITQPGGSGVRQIPSSNPRGTTSIGARGWS